MTFEMEMRSSASYPNLINSYGYAVNHHQSQRRQHRSSSKWSPEENKMFENALAVYDKDSPDKWEKVAAMIPGKTISDVMKQYEELEADVSSIEAGLFPVNNPGYSSPVFTLDWVSGSSSFDGDGHAAFGGKRLASHVKAGSEQDQRKKGVPWTEEEHKLFLLGLKKYGKGDWRNISRNFVITRTPTQVASHAQKYFIRQHSGGKDKRRASIHDITIVNLNDQRHTVDVSPNHVTKGQLPFQWNLHSNSSNNGGSMEFNAAYGGRAGNGMLDSSYMGFQMQSAMHYPQI